MEEKFVKIKGYEGYEVSNTGKIKSLKTNRLLKPQKNNCGYLYILLTDSNKKVRINLVHRLVFDSFIGIDDGLEINHLDEDKENNRLDNLELITHEENLKKYRENHPFFMKYMANKSVIKRKDKMLDKINVAFDVFNEEDSRERNRNLLKKVNDRLRKKGIREISLRTLKRYKRLYYNR